MLACRYWCAHMSPPVGEAQVAGRALNAILSARSAKAISPCVAYMICRDETIFRDKPRCRRWRWVVGWECVGRAGAVGRAPQAEHIPRTSTWPRPRRTARRRDWASAVRVGVRGRVKAALGLRAP